MPRRPLHASITSGWSDAIEVSTSLVGGELRTVVPPTLVLQAVVEGVAARPEGQLIVTLEPAWLAIQEALRRDADLLRNLTWRQWEELIAASYDKAGYDEVILTPRSGDDGRDVIAVRKGWGSVRILDQVKAYKPGHLVTAGEVRELLGTLSGDSQATKGIVTTTSAFAPKILSDPGIAKFMPYRLELVDGSQLQDRLRKLGSR